MAFPNSCCLPASIPPPPFGGNNHYDCRMMMMWAPPSPPPMFPFQSYPASGPFILFDTLEPPSSEEHLTQHKKPSCPFKDQGTLAAEDMFSSTIQKERWSAPPVLPSDFKHHLRRKQVRRASAPPAVSSKTTTMTVVPSGSPSDRAPGSGGFVSLVNESSQSSSPAYTSRVAKRRVQQNRSLSPTSFRSPGSPPFQSSKAEWQRLGKSPASLSHSPQSADFRSLAGGSGASSSNQYTSQSRAHSGNFPSPGSSRTHHSRRTLSPPQSQYFESRMATHAGSPYSDPDSINSIHPYGTCVGGERRRKDLMDITENVEKVDDLAMKGMMKVAMIAMVENKKSVDKIREELERIKAKYR